MKEFLQNGRVRAALVALVVAAAGYFGMDLPLDVVSALYGLVVGAIFGAAVPSEAFGAKK